MSNGNLDNSARLVGVLKPTDSMTKAKRAGAKTDFTKMSHYCNFQIYHSSMKARQGKHSWALGRALGSTWPSPSHTCCGQNDQKAWASWDRWHVPWSKMPEERKEHSRQGNGSSQKTWWQSRANEKIHGTVSDIPGTAKKAWNDEITASMVEGSTNWELLIFQVCQTSVNNHWDCRYFHLPLVTIIFLTQLSSKLGPLAMTLLWLRESLQMRSPTRLPVKTFWADGQVVGWSGSTGMAESQRPAYWKGSWGVQMEVNWG